MDELALSSLAPLLEAPAVMEQGRVGERVWPSSRKGLSLPF